jgi:carbamoyltransferase
MKVLGLHGGVTLGQHEPSAAIAVNGKIVAACEEERYLRVKSSYGHLPYYSIKACLDIAGLSIEDIDLVVTPGITYEDFSDRVGDYLRHNFGSCPKIERVHHHMAHMSAAFYGSGLNDAICLSLDATGDGSCGMIGRATKADGIQSLEEIPVTNSLGYFYTLMTYYLGFGDGDEYKVMGLAPYGEPVVDLEHLIRPTDGGWSFDWSFVRSEPPVRSPFEPLYAAKLAEALGHPNRTPGAPMTEYYRNVARSTQFAMEEALCSLVAHAKSLAPESRNLAYAGGLALNCKANRRLLYSGEFDNIYVPPVASDRGLAIGCAYLGAVMCDDTPWPLLDAYLGSSYSNDHIRNELVSNGIDFEETDDPAGVAAEFLARDEIVGWYQGRSEAGARALGNRSILAACTKSDMKDKVNARIKYREEFRPFAPAIMSDRKDEYFVSQGIDSPHMCFTLDVNPEKGEAIPAVTHVDQTARVQTVRSSDNEMFYEVIRNYDALTGVPVILNTSFNLKGQPIVETPRDALMTFFGCGLDVLFLGNFIVRK